jgi:hypothetical protein
MSTPTADAPATTRTVPAVVRWYGRYCQAALALFVAAAFISVAVLLRRESLAADWGVALPAVDVFAVLWAATMLFLGSVHYAALRTPRAPWAWKIHAVVLGVGLTTLVLWPVALPLLFQWFKPETKAFFGVTAARPGT